MSDLQQRIRANFAAQGLMTTLGAELVHVADGEVRIALLPRPALSQQHGDTHAGAITSVLDSACGYAALTVAPAGMDVLTVCQGEVVGEQGERRETIAVMQATIINVAVDRARSGDP